MDIKQQFTTVTRFSKIVALILFIALPFLGFYLGMQYSKSISSLAPAQLSESKTVLASSTPQTPIACTQEAKVCPDGTSVGRTGSNCEFVACPVTLDQTADQKTYTNNEYGYEIKYPTDWKIDDLSHTYNGIKSIELNATSPARYDLSGYESAGVQYLLKLGVSSDGKIIIGHQGFIKIYESGDQAVTDINLSNNSLTNSEEYKVAQEIPSTFKFTK